MSEGRRQAIFCWLGAAVGLLFAASAALREEFGPAAVVAAGAVFLIYWGLRVDRGER